MKPVRHILPCSGEYYLVILFRFHFLEKDTMKKSTSIFGILVLLAAVLCLGALLLPLGAGFVRTVDGGGSAYTETFRAYDFVFGNKTQDLTVNGYGAFIAAFVMLVVAAAFIVLALLMGFGSSTKFGGFLAFVAGLLAIASGVLYVLAKPIVAANATNYPNLVLSWGFIGAGVAAVACGLASCVGGVLAFKAK